MAEKNTLSEDGNNTKLLAANIPIDDLLSLIVLNTTGAEISTPPEQRLGDLTFEIKYKGLENCVPIYDVYMKTEYV